VWPVANNIELRLQDLYDLKLEREQTTGSRVAEYEKTLPNGAIIRVVGLPDLSQVRSIMLGVLNPDQPTSWIQFVQKFGLMNCA
jgi:cell surface protein SprA